MINLKLTTSIIIILLSLTSCNGGRTYFFTEKKGFKIESDKSINSIYRKEIKVRKLYRKGDVSGMVFLGDDVSSYNEARETLIKKAKNSNIYKNRCAFMISYFIPLYPWDIWFFVDKARKTALIKAIKKAKKSGIKGNLVTDIIFKEVWFGGPIFSYSCVAASANLKEG